MAMDFHAAANRYSYSTRDAQADWRQAVCALVDPTGKRIADLGSGGGIYSAAWSDLGATSVVGIDFSPQMVGAAREHYGARPGLSFREGNAEATGLADASVDIVFERALIHHLAAIEDNFTEAARILTPHGLLLIQDRTPDDVRIPGSPENIRGYFFERFPHLLDTELARRPTTERVTAALAGAGFSAPVAVGLWETRRVYDSPDDVAADLLARTGRSILHQLNDAEIAELVEHIRNRMPAHGVITERDHWTLWLARKM